MITLIRVEEQVVKSKEAFQVKEGAGFIWQDFVVLWQNQELCCSLDCTLPLCVALNLMLAEIHVISL